MDIEEAKKKKNNLSAKISMYKRKGKDITSFRKEWEELDNFLKNNK